MVKPGPKPSTPRLSTLDPRGVANEVVRLVTEHVWSLLFHLDSNARVEIPTDGVGTSLGFSTALLVKWTQTGTNGEDWNSGMAQDAVQMICEALYSRAGEPGTFGIGPIEEAQEALDPDTSIGLLLVAAWTRIQLAQGLPVSAVQLAALAGLSAEHVRLLARQGELQLVEGEVQSDEAKRWLKARGVGGF